MTDLPTLEAALLQKELDHLAAKLAPLVQGIRDVLGEYGDINGNIHITDSHHTPDYNAGIKATQDEILGIGEWLRSLPQVEAGYHAGTILKVCNVSLSDLPQSIERAIRHAAIRKHLEAATNPPRPVLPEPMTEAPEKGIKYFRPAPENYVGEPFTVHKWRGDDFDYLWLRRRLCYRTAEDAAAVAKAQLAILNPAKS